MSSRFECPSSTLRLAHLVRRTRMMLWSCLALAVAVHACFSLAIRKETTQVTAKPLTTLFIKRQPRLTKPLELRKRPAPKRRTMQRRMVAVKARADRQAATSPFRPAGVVRGLARPSIRIGRGVLATDLDMEPATVASAIEGAREQEDKVDMSLEMVDVAALDTGRYKAMVVQDPTDKRIVRGFLHLGLLYHEAMWTHADIAQLNVFEYIRGVVEAMNRYTEVKTDLKGCYTFDSAEMLEIPWIFLNTNRAVFRLGSSQAANLGRYFTGGGFLYVETDCSHPWDRPGSPDGIWRRQELTSGKNMLMDALAAAGYKHGQDWTFQKIPNDHPVFHCYFDFDGPLPSAWPEYVPPDDVMHGITIDGRLLMIFETGDYEGYIRGLMSGARYRQLLVNVVVFALTQEGSLTRRLMNLVNY